MADVSEIIRGGSRPEDLEALARRGLTRVRVIEERRIADLIAEAVRQAIGRESADHAALERRTEAEKSKREIERRLAENRAELDGDSLASQEVERLRSEVTALQARLAETNQVLDGEKRRLAQKSEREFRKLIDGARAELQSRSNANDRVLAEILRRADEMIPPAQREALDPPADGREPWGAALLDALNRRLVAIGQKLEESRSQIASQEEDIAIAAEMRRRLNDEHRKLRAAVAERDAQVERLKEELRAAEAGKQRLPEEVERKLCERMAQARAEYEARARAGEQELRLMIDRLERAIPAEEKADIARCESGAAAPEALVGLLGRHLEALCRRTESAGQKILAHEQELQALRAEGCRRAEELSHQLEERAGQVAALTARIGQLEEQRQTLLAPVSEFREQENSAAKRLRVLSARLARMADDRARRAAELQERMAMQVSAPPEGGSATGTAAAPASPTTASAS